MRSLFYTACSTPLFESFAAWQGCLISPNTELVFRSESLRPFYITGRFSKGANTFSLNVERIVVLLKAGLTSLSGNIFLPEFTY